MSCQFQLLCHICVWLWFVSWENVASYLFVCLIIFYWKLDLLCRTKRLRSSFLCLAIGISFSETFSTGAWSNVDRQTWDWVWEELWLWFPSVRHKLQIPVGTLHCEDEGRFIRAMPVPTWALGLPFVPHIAEGLLELLLSCLSPSVRLLLGI